MFSHPLDKAGLDKLEKLVDESTKIAVTCHVKPDGDAVGSTLALSLMLRKLGKEAVVVTPDVAPLYLRFLPGFKDIVAYSVDTAYAEEILGNADLIFCLDFNAAYRVDRMEKALRGASAPKVMIDHHLDPEAFTDLTVSEPSASSTCFLLFKVFCQLGWFRLIDKEIATCIAAGMMTDTGNFSYNANDPQAYEAMARLLECGIDKVAVWERLNVKSENQLRLTGFTLAEKLEIFHGGAAAVMQLTKEDLDRFDYRKGDLEGLVNVPLQIPTVQVSVLMHQEPAFVKVSMRSVGTFPVNKICETYFSGGGHLNAAGGEYAGSMESARELLEKALTDYNDYFRKQ